MGPMHTIKRGRLAAARLPSSLRAALGIKNVIHWPSSDTKSTALPHTQKPSLPSCLCLHARCSCLTGLAYNCCHCCNPNHCRHNKGAAVHVNRAIFTALSLTQAVSCHTSCHNVRSVATSAIHPLVSIIDHQPLNYSAAYLTKHMGMLLHARHTTS